MSDEDFSEWEKRFEGKTGKAIGNLISARNWRNV
jgi:hypothetical protein